MVAKPGNVSRGRDLPGLSYRDLLLSATSIGPAFRKSGTLRVGPLVLEAIRRTRRHVRTNTNLGIALLLAPLARAALRRGSGTLRDRTRPVLADLDRRDPRDPHPPIPLAPPGGSGSPRGRGPDGARAQADRSPRSPAPERGPAPQSRGDSRSDGRGSLRRSPGRGRERSADESGSGRIAGTLSIEAPRLNPRVESSPARGAAARDRVVRRSSSRSSAAKA